MRYKSALFAVLSVLLLSYHVFAQDISYTLADRDRIIRVEAKVEQMDKRFEQIDKRFEQIDKRFEQIDSRIERLEGVMISGFGLLFTTMIGMVGFVLWDRRTALAPAIRESRELREKEERIERILKEIAIKDVNVAEALRHAGL
jgi:DNA repair exonuclease SbcCD ATPase subunit